MPLHCPGIPLREEAESPAERKRPGCCWAGEVTGTGQKFMSGRMGRGWGSRSERACPCGWCLPPALLSGSAAEKVGGGAAHNQGSRSWQASSEGFDERVAGMRKLSWGVRERGQAGGGGMAQWE